MPSQLLCFGHDEMLLMTRKWLLEKHIQVQLARDSSAVAELVSQHAFEIAILCHTINPKERLQAIDLLREKSKETKILCLTPISGSSSLLRMEEDCVVVNGMAQALITAVLPLLKDQASTTLDRQRDVKHRTALSSSRAAMR